MSGGDGELHTVPLTMHYKALAWYTVTYSRCDRERRQNSKATGSLYRSFPWLVWDVLAYHKRTIVSCCCCCKKSKFVFNWRPFAPLYPYDNGNVQRTDVQANGRACACVSRTRTYWSYD